MASYTLLSGYLALGSAVSSAGVITELSGNGYARVPVTVSYDPVANVVSFAPGVTFPTATGTWSAYTVAALFDAASGGNEIAYAALPGAATASGANVSFPQGIFTIACLSGVLVKGGVTPAGVQLGVLNNADVTTSGTAVYIGPNPLSLSASYALTANATSYNDLTAPPILFRNLLDGGDFTVNPFQRNIATLASAGIIASAITSTPTYFADRWFGVGGASSSLLMGSVANVTVPGFSVALQHQRSSGNANTSPLYLGQILEPSDVVRLQGQGVVFSVLGLAGSGFTGGTYTISIVSGTDTAANTTAAKLIATTWAGQSTIGTATVTPSTTASRAFVTATVPAAATQLAVLISWTPSSTAAGSYDYLQFLIAQLELGTSPGTWERRDIQVETEICQRYAWAIPEPAASVIVGAGFNPTTSTQVFYLAAPVQFWKAPTVTVAAGTFKTNQASVATACTITAGTTHTPNAISVNGSSTGTAGQGTLLQGGGGSGYILASADF